MALSKRSIALALGLIEDRITQLDPLVPQDADDLENLLRCREEMKVTGEAVQAFADERSVKTGRHGRKGARRQSHACAAPGMSLDVI